MGSKYSRFREAVHSGDTEQAYELYYRKKSFRESIEPNESLGATYDENTPLHCAALYGMKQLYIDLIAVGGRPDQKNKLRRNCLHLICVGGRPGSDPMVRADMLKFTFEMGLSNMDIHHVLEEKDEEGNTALHFAASAGLEDCVELLMNMGADVFITNSSEETAADCATRYHHPEIATKLETKMVFHPEDDHEVAMDPDPSVLQEIADGPTAMRDRDIRSMKDQLLIETAQLLGVSLFTAEALLKNHGWSKEQLLEAWMENPVECCEKSGVPMPTRLAEDNLDHQLAATSGGGGEEAECGICTLPCSREIQVPCEHTFCKECWQQYLHMRIETGDHTIACPEYACYIVIPQEVIERVVSREMSQKYLHFDIKAFVESNPNFRWCPHPGCGQAVTLGPSDDAALFDRPFREERGKSFTVHCGNDHYFCWECGSEPHDPCDCELWKKWIDHIEEMKPRIGDMTTSEANEAASNKWLAKRSKPCPKCRAPIEKTEGCNHICCKKCRHDFCWVCLDEWRNHNSSTGGYFECNRYDARKKADEMLVKRREQVMSGFDEIEKIGRFLHYHERYKSHRESLALEEPFLNKARHKMEELYRSVQNMDGHVGTVTLDMSFIEEAVRELLQSRRVLIASYGFGYYVKGNSAKTIFESLQDIGGLRMSPFLYLFSPGWQGTLEELTEMLAEVVARPHLRKPRSEIIRLTRETREKRMKLVKEVKKGLPPPTPPMIRRYYSRRRYHDDSSPDSLDSDGVPDVGSRSDRLMILNGLLPLRRRAEEQSSSRSHDRSHDDLQRAMEVSRREYEEEKQLNDDIEYAKMLSMQRPPPPEPQPELQPEASTAATASRLWLDELPTLSTHEPKGHKGMFNWMRLSEFLQRGDAMSLSSDEERVGPGRESLLPAGRREPEPSSSRRNMDTGRPWPILSSSSSGGSSLARPLDVQASTSSSSSNGDPVGEFGPLFGEDEDLRRAIEMSLRERPDTGGIMEISGPQFLDSNRLDGDRQFPSLPPELRHLLTSSDRTGTPV